MRKKDRFKVVQGDLKLVFKPQCTGCQHNTLPKINECTQFAVKPAKYMNNDEECPKLLPWKSNAKG